MIPYASHTNSGRNLTELRRHGWRLLRTPFTQGNANHGFAYALDNGAWRAFQQGVPFDEEAFDRALHGYADQADWIAVPDVVCGGLASLDFSLSWLAKLRPLGRLLLICVQDGMQDEHIEPLLSQHVGVFVGGSTDWKEQSAPRWGELCHRRGAYLHVGRVNTARRIAICAEAGAQSFDGSSATRFSKNVRRLTLASRQVDLFADARTRKIDP